MASEIIDAAMTDHFKHKLCVLRQGLGVSGAVLDGLSGYAAGTVGRLERGDQRIYASHLFRIAEVAGVDINYFYDGLDGEEGGDPLKDLATPAKLEAQQLLAAFLKIEDRTTQVDILDLIQTLAREQGFAADDA